MKPSSAVLPILGVLFVAACGGDEEYDEEYDEAGVAAEASESAPVTIDSSAVAVPGAIDSSAAAGTTDPGMLPPEVSKDSIPQGSGKGKGRP